MITLPFKVSCLETAPAGALEVTIRLSATAPPSADGLSLIKRLMSHFVQVVANGGLAGSNIHPTDSTLSLVREHISADLCSWKFDDVHIAPGARLVLENIALFIHLNVSPVLKLDLAVPRGSQMVAAQNRIPRLFASLPFQYLFEPEAAEVVIDIEFESPIHDIKTRDPFVNLWDSWLYVSAAGGFETEDFSARRITIFPSGEPEFQFDQLSFFMEDVSVSNEAFDVLVNGFHKLHYTIPLKRLHIY